MKKLLIKSFVRLIFSYVYAFVGGCIFYAIERKPETNQEISSRLSRKLHRDFSVQFNISINESDFKCFMQKAFEVVTVGNKMDWSILTGLSLTMTSLTTIGKWSKALFTVNVNHTQLNYDSIYHTPVDFINLWPCSHQRTFNLTRQGNLAI